jgi:hypothetical protein
MTLEDQLDALLAESGQRTANEGYFLSKAAAYFAAEHR